MKKTYRVQMTAQAPSGVCAVGIWVVDALSPDDAIRLAPLSAMRGGWVPLQVHWAETPEENDARVLAARGDKGFGSTGVR